MSSRKLPLSKERIFDAALRLVDSGGVESLSMRRLGAELGVQAMSLYNHVTNKDAILYGLIDHVVGEIELPRLGDPWKIAMRNRANSAHAMLLRHPWAITTMMTRSNSGPAMVRYVNATLGCLRMAGFSHVVAGRAWNAMDNHIYGYTLQEARISFDAPEYAQAARSFLSRIAVEEYPYVTELATLVGEGRDSGFHDFTFGLEVILDGLDRYRSTA